MTTKEHKKHSDITRPSYGFYGRNEWAIVGTQCNVIRSLADSIINALSPAYTCAYADATHADEKDNIVSGQPVTRAALEYCEHPAYHRFTYSKPSFNNLPYRQLFNDADLIFVNGNHFEAKSQVVVIDETKRASLKKRLAQLTNVELILLADNEIEVFDFIRESLPSWDKLPVYKLNDTINIIEFFRKKMEQQTALLNGLVLAGGKSVRMGYDKGLIEWHGKEQQYYMADLLKDHCTEVYISCRRDQQKLINNIYKTLTDTFTELGPYGAILSAFREKPDVAWLVVACDLPLLDTGTLQYLKDHRNPSSMATAYESPFNGFPEPMISIWEPKSYPVLLSFLSQGYNCPVRALRNMDTTVLKPQDPGALSNVNTREELAQVQQLLQNKLPLNHAT
jgi:molybdenum cofactor guanylyltransferase